VSRLSRFLADGRVATIARVALGVLFVYAGLTKLEPLKFAHEVANYRLLPPGAVNLVAVTLPFIEILAGGLLVVGLRIRTAALVAGVLLCGFVVAMVTAWVRGLDVECGCFGKGTRIGLRAVAEDVAMLGLAVEAYLFDRGRLGLDRLVLRLGRT
jgi:putative oxidoreductase